MMHPFTIVSLLDVLKLNTGNALAAQSSLGAIAAEWRMLAQLAGTVLSPHTMSLERKARVLHTIQQLRDLSGELGLAASSRAGEEAYNYLMTGFAASQMYGSADLNNFFSCVDRLLFCFVAEMETKLVFIMPSKHADFYSDDAPFGEQVDNAFPSVSYDVSEAAKCRSLGRWTACVMHVMRVLEVGLGALARHLEIDPGDGNWNTVLNQIEARAREIGKRTHGKDAEQWTAEAGTHLRFIKNAWRNHAMHPLEKYDEERAVAIFDNARSFMQHLAGRLAE